MQSFLNYRTAVLAAVFAGLIGSIVYLHKDSKRTVRAVQAEHQQLLLSMATRQAELERANAELQRAQAHYVHLYDLYAAMARYRQYGELSDNVAIFHREQKDFVPIESVTEKLICPKTVKKLPNGFTYFGIRNIVLGRKGQAPLFYSISYMGNHAFIRDRDEFDSLIDLGNPGAGRIVRLPESQAANLMSRAPRPLTRNGSFITPFSFNSRDINNDGTDDFFFGGHLFLSEKGDYEPIADKALDGREVVFANNEFLSPKGAVIERWSHDEGHLVKVGEVALESPVATNRPFTILPLDGAVTDRADVIVITASSYDFYALRDGKAERVMSLPASAPHSVIVGARGDFDGDGKDDLWLTESRWRNKDGKIVGRAALLSSRKFKSGASRLEDIASFILYGAEAYTDFDGVGVSLSPVAGDFDRDGKPDLSVSGHIHMNEAGALYIVRGKDIAGRSDLSITDAQVIRIVGRPVSNLAPPFFHYDLPSPQGARIVAAADNDLCSGAAGGAIYILDIAKLIEERGS
jgi:hypothetical protein